MTTRIGPYEILSELGRGGMGVVYRVRHGPTGTERAVKLLPPGSHPVAVERFRREVEALARLGRSGVVAIHDAGVDAGRPYYAMELMPGGSLRARLDSRGKAPWQEAAALGAALARTLERCHELGLVHRDLKPENVLFDEHGAPRLADFGCVKDLGAATLTKTGQPVGTFLYMASEQLEGRPADARADIFSLAVIVHELAAGEHPWARAGTILELLDVAKRRPRPRLAALVGAPPALDVVLDRALAPDLRHRTPSARVFGDELEAVLAGSDIRAPFARQRALLAVLGAVALAAAAAVIGVASRPSAPPEVAPVSSAAPTPRLPEKPRPLTPEEQADALTDAGRWAEVAALDATDAHLKVRKAWALYRINGDLAALVRALDKIPDLAPGASAALEGFRAREHFVRPLHPGEQPPRVRSEIQAALRAMAASAPRVDPRLRDPVRDAALLEDVLFDEHRTGADPTTSFVRVFLQAAAAVLPERSEDLVAIRTIAAFRLSRADAAEDRRSLERTLRASADVKARYPLARALRIAEDGIATALATGSGADMATLVADMQRLAGTAPDAGDEKLDATPQAAADVRPHAVAALAAAIAASNETGAADRTRWLATANDELRLAAVAVPDDAARAEVIVASFAIAVVGRSKAAGDIGKDPVVKGFSEETFMRGEHSRLAGRFDSARQLYFSQQVRTPRCGSRFFLEVLRRDSRIGEALAAIEDAKVPPADRARARELLATERPVYLGWLRRDIERVLAGR